MPEGLAATFWWIPVTLFAALAQTGRNAAQRSLTGSLGTWAAMPQDATREYALSVYSGVFTQMMWIGLVAGALLFAATPLLKRLTRG